MGPWDKALKVAKDIGENTLNSISENANEIRQINAKLESKSDEELIKIINSEGFFESASKEKGVAFRILKSRGFSVEEISAYKA